MRIINFIFVVLFFNTVLIAQNYSIFGKIDDMPDGEVLLGYYYGDKQFDLGKSIESKLYQLFKNDHNRDLKVTDL